MQYRKDKNGNDLSMLGYGCMRFTKKGSSIDIEKAEKEIKAADEAAERTNEYHKYIEDRQKEGKPLPAGETLNRDAGALKKAADGEKKGSDSEK